MKFFKKHSNKLYLIGSLFLLIMIGIISFLIDSHFYDPVRAAQETWTLTVNKTSAITVYVSGKGVTYDSESSTNNVDIYKVEKDTSISLNAVNESRIFTGWEFTGNPTIEDGELTTSKIYITPVSDMSVSTTRRDALAADYGLYMNSRFYINLDIHLIHLQRIFDAGNNEGKVQTREVLEAYDYFFEKERNYERTILTISNYDQTSRENKANLIVSGKYFDKIQNGCYQINSSFALMDESFIGIGNKDTPFNGVLDGNVNGAISTIFIASSTSEQSDKIYRGLFQVTGENAVIRNINIRSSFGVSANSSTPATDIYVGGIAGQINNSILSNVDVLARIAVDSTSANIYAGCIAGELIGGLDHNRNVKLNGKDSTFILSTNDQGKSIYAGLISGNATNVYVKEANADVSNFAISANNTSSSTYNANTNVYLGNLFGKFTATEMIPIENVKINGTEKETLTSLMSSGNSYIGGLMGHLTVNANNSNLQLGDVQFNITSGESKFAASSVDKNSQTNLLTAGLIACVVGNNLNAREEFLDGVVEKVVDGEKRYEYSYIFNTNLKIESLNHGMMNGSTYGKVIATGFIARGFMNLNGLSNDNRNEILLTSGKYQTKVYATQSSTTSYANGNHNTGENDKEHCIATAFYGNMNRTNFTVQNLNVYGANYDIAATRELGSFGKSDVHAAGFIGYTLDVTLSNISLYLNDSFIKGHSLSYEVTNTTNDVNNTYVGGVVGSINDTDYNTFKTMSNITFAGLYDHHNDITLGTTTVIEGMQNTKGNNNYRNENYVGGIFGRIYRTHVDGLYFIGSESNEDSINSLGHEDPATAFCGGIIGYVKNNNNTGTEISIRNTKIENAKVYIGATVTNRVDSQPDVYIGGIIGSTFNDGQAGTVTIDNAKVIDTQIIAEGNEHVMIFVGGVMGNTCWAGTANINNAYVVGCSIESHLYVSMNVPDDPRINSCAAGIMGRTTATSNIRYSAVIDTNIIATYNNTFNNDTAVVTASGIHGERDGTPTVNITGCYSNATLKSLYKTTTVDRNGNCFGISDSSLNGTVSNSYYVTENVGNSNNGTTDGTGLSFSEKSVTLAQDGNNTNRLFTNLAYDDTNKYFIFIDDSDKFGVYENNNHLRVYAKEGNVSSYASIWINAKQNGDANSPDDSVYDTEEALINAGWFNLGDLVVYNGNPTITSTKSNALYTFSLGSGEYQLKNDGKYHNIHYPYDILDFVPYDISTPTTDNIISLGGKNSTIEELIVVNVANNMHSIKLDFKITPSNLYPALFDSNGNIIGTTGLLHEEYGVFEYNITGDNYTIIYRPNEEIEYDQIFYIGFVNEDNSEVYSKCYKFDIRHNAYKLEGTIYADYTKPINYQFIEYNNDVVYLVRPNTITKLIPVFSRADNSEIIVSETNISKVSYSTTGGSIKSNGEFTSPNTVNSTGTITITFIESGIEYTHIISYKVVNSIDVSYTSIGADLNGLVYSTSDSDYVLDVELLDHYGGDPITFNVFYEGVVAENTFVSPVLNGTINQLSLRLGGAVDTIEFYASKNGGTTWEQLEDISVVQTYNDYLIEDFIGYNRFKLINKSQKQIGINSFSLIQEDVSTKYTANLANSSGDTIVDNNGDTLFTMTNAELLASETTINFSNLTDYDIPSNSSFVLDVFPEDNDYDYRYSAVTVQHVGTADIKYEALTAEYSNRTGWSDTVPPIWVDLSTINGQWNVRNSRRVYDIRITITNTSDNFKITDISYSRGTNNNNNANQQFSAFDENNSDINGNQSITISSDSDKFIEVIDSSANVTFTFNDAISNVNPIVSQGSISNVSINNNTYTFTGTNDLQITGFEVDLLDDVTTTYTFSGNATSTTATFNVSTGGTAQATINGCNVSGNNLLLYGTGNITIEKSELIERGWIDTEEWDIEKTHYRLTIPKDFIATMTDAIQIEIEFPIVYTISFDLQSDSFNHDYTGEKIFTFKAIVGTTFDEMFGGVDNPYMEILNKAVGPESQGGVKKFGFVFGGFYLIDTGNTLSAYSISFAELLEKNGSMKIESSYMYYARWSFLIELIEAPGTNITTSFESGFMDEVGLTEEERNELELKNSISIPINNNRGYVFTVQKEAGFIGEAQVNAYIVTAPSEKHTDLDDDLICDICHKPYDLVSSENVTEITIEKYHDNMYLYYIPPEAITGYLVIVSSVSNSTIIVGRNTASVTEQILPEDGVYTFKYVVNHKRNESYIYDTTANLLSLKRNVLIEFYDQIYNGETTDIINRHLLPGTVIEVFYSLYEDGALTAQAIGAWTASGGETSVTLDKFKKWNQVENAFDSNLTFNALLKDNEATSEVFYFVVTPPNGQNTGFTEIGNEIINEVIFVGYCDGEGNYLYGRRNNDDIVNLPIEDYISGLVSDETSLQAKIYSITPSRQTDLTGSGNNYNFNDINTYHILDLIPESGTLTLTENNRLVLEDSASNNTVVYSSIIKGNIREIELTLGFNTGLVRVYGKKTTGDWDLIETFNVDSADYKSYFVSFERVASDYVQFKIDNISQNEIRLESFKYVTISNGMVYEFNLENKEIVDNKISFINEIKGDTRHDGKSFMLAIEYEGVTNISKNVSITVTTGSITKTYTPLLADREGKVVAYYNLSEIINELGVNSISITLNNDTHTLASVKLLEALSALKPAVSEERVVIIP